MEAAPAQVASQATPLTPLAPPPSLTESTADRLRERILNGGFLPGQRLVEAEIARQLGISRGPVREALAQLRAEGLAHEEPRRGSFVAELTPDDVREIYELRGALEGRAARLIIERGDDAALRQLGEVMDELRAAAKVDDREAFARIDAAFHAELCRLSGNRRLHRAFVQHAGLLGTLLRLEITTQYESIDPLLAEHERLYEDICSGDADRASAGCDRHLAEALERVTQMRQA